MIFAALAVGHGRLNRHSRRASCREGQGAGEDPPLDGAGAARAALLARMFGDAQAAGHLDAIYVSPALRNRLTAAPLAARLGLTPAVAPADDPRGLARRVLREHPGGRFSLSGTAIRCRLSLPR